MTLALKTTPESTPLENDTWPGSGNHFRPIRFEAQAVLRGPISKDKPGRAPTGLAQSGLPKRLRPQESLKAVLFSNASM